MTLQTFFVLFLAYGCLAESFLEINGPILQKIDILANEVQFLKKENSNKEQRIQILEGKVNFFELESQIQKETIIKLTNEVEILKNETNKIETDIQVQNDPLQEHTQMSGSKFLPIVKLGYKNISKQVFCSDC